MTYPFPGHVQIELYNSSAFDHFVGKYNIVIFPTRTVEELGA
jgi:hypothetical protein